MNYFVLSGHSRLPSEAVAKAQSDTLSISVPIDVALVPVSGKFVATAREAADEVNRLRPALAIPMHYGAVAGSRADADEFARLVQVPVKVLL